MRNIQECERPSCIQGYHIYQEVWVTAVGEELVCEREPDNSLGSLHDLAVGQSNCLR